MTELGETLSERELDVLRLIVQGAANKEIAQSLMISENTVKVHLRRIYAKMGVSSRTEAATQAMQTGLVTVPGFTPSEPLPVVAADLPAADETAVSLLPDPPPTPSPAPETAEPAPVITSPLPLAHPWRVVSLVLGMALLLVVAILILVGQSFLNRLQTPDTPLQTPVSFTETAVGDTQWLHSQPLPTPRTGLAVAAVGLDVYAIGGETADGVVGDVAVYDTTTLSWQTAATKPTAVADTTAAVLFGEIYVPGGRLPNGPPTDVVETYSPANDAWRAIAPLPQPLSGGLAMVRDGLLYLFGGQNGSAYLDTAYEYNPGLNSWRPLPGMGAGRAFTGGGAIAGQLYVVGGFDGQQELDRCQYFDLTNGTWHECPALLQPRAGVGTAVLLNHLYIFGGGLSPANSVTFGEQLISNTQTWQAVEMPMLADNGRWVYLGVTNVETRIYALGGQLNGQISAANYVMPALFQTFIPAINTEP